MCYDIKHISSYLLIKVLETFEFVTTIEVYSFIFIGFSKSRFLVFNKDTQVNNCITKAVGFLKS